MAELSGRRIFFLEHLKSHNELLHYISSQGKAAFEGRQLAKRLRDLLPLRMKKIKDEWRRSHRPGRAEREALADQRLLDHIDELVLILGDSHESRVQYETHSMLIKARQSLRKRGTPQYFI
jgi:hypothetical protein